jgi:alkanesulfonate monooxygenase SsuD/methylene tetrahydromethanopterin reductase-like flavin-dependent oxidoreductase (luciferase family)
MTPMETRREIVVRAAVLADQLGYEFFILAEGWGFDSTLVLTEIALKTERIRPMSGILSVWNRSPGTIAMNAATLADISDGRYVLGLGASTKALVEGFHGLPFRQPTDKLRDTTRAVRRLLQGERAEPPGEIGSRALRLGQAARPDLPIYVAALGPRAVAIAAELADGWFPAYVARDRFAKWVPELLEKRKSAGVMKSPLTVIAGPGVSVNADADAARQTVANILAWYLCAMGDVYAKFVASQGFQAEVDAVLRANPKPSPNRGEIPSDAEVLLDQLYIHGAPDKVSEELKAWDEAVDVNALGISPGIPWPDIEAIIRAGAPES